MSDKCEEIWNRVDNFCTNPNEMGWLCTMNSIKFLLVLLLINVNQFVSSLPSSSDGDLKINETTSSSSSSTVTTTTVTVSTSNDNRPTSSTRHESSTKISTERLKGKFFYYYFLSIICIFQAIWILNLLSSSWWMDVSRWMQCNLHLLHSSPEACVFSLSQTQTHFAYYINSSQSLIKNYYNAFSPFFLFFLHFYLHIHFGS